MPTIAIEGARFHWEEAGAGDPVLFIHGFPFNASQWQPQLGGLSFGWRGIAPDLRGFGHSDVRPDSSFTMDDMADDLRDLLDHLAVEQAVVCGLSMGGYVALAFWRRHGLRVRALVLCDTRAEADTTEGRRSRQELAARVRAEGSAAVAQSLLPSLLAEGTFRDRPDVVATVRGMMEFTPPETLARASLGMAERSDATALLATIRVPTLVVVGAEDGLTPPTHAESMVAAIRAARLAVIPRAGHLANLEDPATFNSVLGEFLADLPKPAPSPARPVRQQRSPHS